jgi:mRNA interferase RelE/StbE
MAERPYRVTIHATARRELLALTVAVRRRIAGVIDSLAIDPRPPGSKLLAGKPSERIWRVRVGDYRILYEIRDRELVILVIRIGHRRDVYRSRRPRT